MRFPEYDDHDGLGLAELVKRREVTAAELVEAAIERIEARNPSINAVIRPLFDRARTAARGPLPAGPFEGVPFLLKDLLAALEGTPLGHGARMYQGWFPAGNSALVDRYLASGAVVMGKSNTPELGLVPSTEPIVHGPTRNPWNHARTAGGSSGGSAAAVAARMVPLAGGGDGGGSIRIPSSCCGIFGLKPSRGRTPTGPLLAQDWNGFAIEHVLTRSVRDSAAMLDAVCGWHPGDFDYLERPATPFLDEVARPPGSLRIAVSAEPYLPSKVHPDVVAALDDAATLLTELGHEVIRDAPRIDGAAFTRAFITVVAGQTAASLRVAEKRLGRKVETEDFELRTRLSAAAGRAFSAGDYVSAVNTLLDEARKVHQFLETCDVLVNPTVGQPPPPLGFLAAEGARATAEKVMARLPFGKALTFGPLIDQIGADVFSFIPWTAIYNVTGQPSMSVPLWWNSEGLPVGTMFTARYPNDALLFRLAAQLEQARPWASKKPPGI